MEVSNSRDLVKYLVYHYPRLARLLYLGNPSLLKRRVRIGVEEGASAKRWASSAT
jgi:hypothetical protein